MLGEGFARSWSALGMVVSELEVMPFGQQRFVTLLGGTRVGIGREAGYEAPIWSGRVTALYGALQGIEIGRALLAHLGVIPPRSRIRAVDGLTSSGLCKQHPGWRRLAAVPQSTVGGVGIETGHVVSAA